MAVKNPSPELRPEMLARVRFLARVQAGKDETGRAMFAPSQAFRTQEGVTKAWIVKSFDGSYGFADERTVQLGRTKMEGWVQVTDGLRPGDLVIEQPSGSISQGARIRVMGEVSGR